VCRCARLYVCARARMCACARVYAPAHTHTHEGKHTHTHTHTYTYTHTHTHTVKAIQEVARRAGVSAALLHHATSAKGTPSAAAAGAAGTGALDELRWHAVGAGVVAQRPLEGMLGFKNANGRIPPSTSADSHGRRGRGVGGDGVVTMECVVCLDELRCRVLQPCGEDHQPPFAKPHHELLATNCHYDFVCVCTRMWMDACACACKHACIRVSYVRMRARTHTQCISHTYSTTHELPATDTDERGREREREGGGGGFIDCL
jgi:hypothetical protein